VILELEQKGYEHNEVDPRIELVKKILAGDNSDNIPRVHKSMTPKKVEALVTEVLNELPNVIADIDNRSEQVVIKILEMIKAQGKVKDEESESVTRNLRLNINIIRLKSTFFPNNITELIDRSINRYAFETFNSNKFKNILKVI